ncbi:MAG: hypothetical protein AABY36_07780 [Campylobacterota bacterium]
MKNIIIITVNLTLSVLMVALISWFENEKIKIDALNKKHQEDTNKLQKISQINSWLEELIFPMIKIQPIKFDEGALNIVRFYDDNMHSYNLSVDKYFYKEDVSENIDFSYNVDASSVKNIRELINLGYEGGFLQFLEFKTDKKNIVGKIQLIQPYNGESNATISK